MDLATLAPAARPWFDAKPPQPARSPLHELAWRALDEVDVGMLLVDAEGRLQHANHMARQELAQQRFLGVEAGTVTARDAAQEKLLVAALRLGATGRRQMFTLSAGDDALTAVVVPLGGPANGAAGAPATLLLMLGRRPAAQALAVTFYARAHRLTPAEESVLRALCAGQSVQAIASDHGVAESTVRTQIRTLRDKTGAGSIRHLVQRVASLPPVVPVSLQAVAPAAQWAA